MFGFTERAIFSLAAPTLGYQWTPEVSWKSGFWLGMRLGRLAPFTWFGIFVPRVSRVSLFHGMFPLLGAMFLVFGLVCDTRPGMALGFDTGCLVWTGGLQCGYPSFGAAHRSGVSGAGSLVRCESIPLWDFSVAFSCEAP